MGEVEIDIPTMETENAIPSVVEDTDTPTGMQEPVTPPPAPKKSLGTTSKVIIIIIILIIGSFGAFVAYQMTVPDITGVQLFIKGESVDGDSLNIGIQVNTGFMSSYDGDADIIVEYNGTQAAVITAHIVGSAGNLKADYEDFFVDNGEYTFSIEIESFKDDDEREVVKTANSIVMGSPTPNNRSTIVFSSVPLKAYSVRGAFTIYEGVNTLSDAVAGEGEGTVQLIESDTGNIIAETDFMLFTSNDVAFIETESADSEGNTIGGGYVVDFNFDSTTYPVVSPEDDTDVYFNIVFTNTYPDISVADPIVLEDDSESYTLTPAAPN